MKKRLDLESLYLKMPIWAQNLIVSHEGKRIVKRRYNREFFRTFDAIKERDFLPHADLQLFQKIRMREFMRRAMESPFWSDRFDKYEVSPKAPDVFTELNKLPILSKEEAKQHLEQIKNRSIRQSDLLACHTSGTTGSGLVFITTKDFEREQWAVWWRYRQCHGISFDTACGYFGGRSIVPLRQHKPPYWRMNSAGKQLMFSAYHLKFDTATLYGAALTTNSISWLHGYPSTLTALAGFLKDHNFALIPSVKVITTGAESLLSSQRRIISNVFKAPVFQHYGQAEGVANISECQFGRLHVDEDFSFVEFVPIAGSDKFHRIIGTNWANPAFPLFRYDTGDIATLSSDQCRCGRQGRIVAEIDGRKEDFLFLPDGAMVGRLDHIFKDLVHVREAQIYQKDKDSVVFRIIKGVGYDQANEEVKLINEARKRIGPDIKISLEYPVTIPRTKSGKLRFVISDIEAAQISTT